MGRLGQQRGGLCTKVRKDLGDFQQWHNIFGLSPVSLW
jgi:hypothetical protein